MPDHAVPVCQRIVQGPTSLASGEVGPEYTTNQRVVDHRAASKVGPVTVCAAVARGYEVPVFGSFNADRDTVVARIDPQSIENGVRELVRHAEFDAIFVSCTSVRLMEACAELEQHLGIPLTSSNHAMAWHALRLGGIDDQLPELGSLFTLPLS